MTTEVSLPRSEWALGLLLVPCWLAFANVVSFAGLILWVVIPSLVATQAMLIMIWAQRRILAGLVLLFLAGLSTGLSQLIGGNYSGSITRSTLMMTACAGLMALMWRTRWPATAAIVAMTAFAGAIGLGAAHKVVWLTGIFAVAVVAYLAAVGPLTSEDLADHGRLRRFAAALVASAVIGSLAGHGLYAAFDDPWLLRTVGPKALGGLAITSSSAALPPAFAGGTSVKGSGSDMSKPKRPRRGLDEIDRIRGSATGMSKPKDGEWRDISADAYIGPKEQPVNPLFVISLSLITVLLAVGLLRLMWVQAKWLLLGRRLRRGSPAESVAGAWHWLRLTWARSDYFKYALMSPDRIAQAAVADGDPRLADLAAMATQALYARDAGIPPDQAGVAWQNARALYADVRGPWTSRVRTLLITPAAANRKLAQRERLTTGILQPRQRT